MMYRVYHRSACRIAPRTLGKCLLCVITCTVDNVGFVKGLDKYNMPRPEDVMVPVPQINQGTVAVTQHVPQDPFELVPAGHGVIGNTSELHWTSLRTVFRQSARATLLSCCCRSSGVGPVLGPGY